MEDSLYTLKSNFSWEYIILRESFLDAELNVSDVNWQTVGKVERPALFGRETGILAVIAKQHKT